MAFNPNPEFTGYTTNGLIVITELDFNVTIYGCMDDSYCNYNEAAEEDDRSCIGIPGCIDDHYVELDAIASCSLEGACATTWENAFLNEVENTNLLQQNLENEMQNSSDLQNELSETIAAADLAAQNAVAELNSTIAAAELGAQEAQAILSNTIIDAEFAAQNAELELNASIESANQAQIQATNLLDNTIANFETLEGEYLNEIADLSSPILIDIIEGWNIIGYTRQVAQDAVATLDAISDQILIVKNNDAEVYWPEFGFNGIGDLIPGQGYQMKTSQMIADYYFPDTQGERLNVFPTVPQWVIDLPADVHPNDIRSLVKVVNTLGQEVNPEDSLKGTTLIYLYNDASVEKKIK